MHTLSGKRFDLGGEFTPSVRDVAVGLSRLPRWAGATLVPWSVLQHSVAVFIQAEKLNLNSEQKLLALWHDAEEIATGDIPSPFKTEQQRELQHVLHRFIWEGALGVRYPLATDFEQVKILDNAAKAAEAHVLCHPNVRGDFGLNSLLTSNAVDALWGLYDWDVESVIGVFTVETTNLLADLTA